MTDNLSLVVRKIDDLKLEQRPIPEPNEFEVLLKVNSVGICGSDVHYWKHGRIGNFILKSPMVLGHETSATVAKIGTKVTNLKVGDRVAVEPGLPCRRCDYCLSGRYNLCPDVFFLATPPCDGSLCRYFAFDSQFCFKLPDHVTDDEGAMLEPLSVGVHACNRSSVKPGMTILILGAGPIGLVTLLAAKAYGATSVCIADIVENRLELAKQLGADHTVLLSRGGDAREAATHIQKTMGVRPDVTMECSGAESCIKIALYVTRNGGKVQLIGLGPNEITIPITEAATREVDILGCLRYHNTYPTALDLVATGKINLKPLVTHHFSLEDSIEAFETVHSGKGNPVKVIIRCNN